jgi:cytoskeleton protein RodZ
VVLALVALLQTWWQGYLEWPGIPQSASDMRSDAPVILLPPLGETAPPSIQRDVAPLLQDEKPVEPLGGTPAAPSALSGETAAGPGTPEGTPVAPVAEQAPPPAPAVPETVIELSGRSWLEVLDSSGAFKLNGTFEKGYRKTFEGEPPYRIAIGNYTAARVLVGGKLVDLLPHFNGRIVRFTLDPREPLPQ